MDKPLEECDISPVKTCELQTRLLPSLSPVDTCHMVPSHTCHNTWIPRVVSKPVLIRWCMDNTEEVEEEDSLEEVEEDGEDSLEEETDPVLDARLLFNDL